MPASSRLFIANNGVVVSNRKYFESVKNYLEHLLRDSAEDLTKLFCVDTNRTENSIPLKQL